MRWICTGPVSGGVPVKGECWVSRSIALFLVPFEQGLSLNLELGWQPASLISAPTHCWSYRGTQSHPAFTWVLGI